MTTARIVLLDEHSEQLHQLLFNAPGVEGAAFILCGEFKSETTLKLVSHAVVAIDSEHFLRRERDALSIGSAALMRIAKLARSRGLSIIFAHSHPDGFASFSAQDDEEEALLLPFLQSRVPDRLHGTIVSTGESLRGRIYDPRQQTADVLLAGRRIQLHGEATRSTSQPLFDRQVRAFGPDIQEILTRLHIGVVGLGGTGSILAEQLCRLGVGKLSLVDADVLDATNVNRVYGSTLHDVGRPKVEVARDRLDQIGIGTTIEAVRGDITIENIARVLPACDVLFGCTDKQRPRAILSQIALRYVLPVFDLGVLIESRSQRIKSIYGRVTMLGPGESCLFCRGRITPETILAEALPKHERMEQIREGYAPELDTPAPAVIPFTSAIASFAVAEFLHRLTQFMGRDRVSSEILIAFDQSRIRTNREAPLAGCQCADETHWGRGDETPFLGITWPTQIPPT